MAKKKHEEEHENHERWLVSYADFITLLFAFFTVLYATSQKDVSKAEEFQRSVQKSFRSFMDFGGLIGKFVGHFDQTQIVPPPIDVVPAEGLGPGEGASDAQVYDYVKAQIDAALQEDELSDVQVELTKQGVRLTIPSSNIFDAGSSLIKEEALPYLDKIARVILHTRKRIFIEGHTDDTPIASDKFPSNWDLSAARASTIARYLVLKHKIDPKRLAVVGLAEQKPIVPNNNPVNKAKNRRIEFFIVGDGAPTL